MQRILNMGKLGEEAFLNELKKKQPDLTPSEIQHEVDNWYMDRPGAPFGDGCGRVGDPSRFRKLT